MPDPWYPGDYGDATDAVPPGGGAPLPTPSIGQDLSRIFGGLGGALHGAALGGAPHGVVPPPPAFVPPQYATNALPPLPTPGRWNSSMSSMTGAPLTPNNTGLPYPAIPPSTNWGDPNVAQWESGMNLINTQKDALQAKRNYTAQLPQKWAAEGNVLDARQRALSSQSSYLQEQLRANQTSMFEEQQVQAARANPTNALNVARAERERQQTDYRYQIAGLPTPIEVRLPEGFQGQLPAGIRARLETIADKLTRQFTDAAKLRQYNLEAARIATAQAGQEVTAADIASGRVALTLDQAEQAVRLAGLDVDQAQLAAAASKMPAAPGFVWDAKGNQWVKEGDLADITKQRETALAGPLGSLTLDALMTLLNDNSITPDEFRSTLTNPQGRYGYLDGTVDYMLRLAELKKGAGGSDDLIAQILKSLGAPPPAAGAGGSQPAGPTTTGGTVLGNVLNTLP